MLEEGRRYLQVADASEETWYALGSLVGRLHSLPAGPEPCTRRAGSWHHLPVDGGGRDSDVAILRALLQDPESRLGRDEQPLMQELRTHVERVDDLEDLPRALIHPDPCGANLIALDGDDGVLVDWAGAGEGPRLLAFANLIGSASSLSAVDAAVAGYRALGTLEEEELDRLEGALVAFPLILDCWPFLFQGAPLPMLMNRFSVHQQRARAIADRVRTAFAEPVLTVPAAQEDNQASLF